MPSPIWTPDSERTQIRDNAQRLIERLSRPGELDKLTDRERAQLGPLLKRAHQFAKPPLLFDLFPDEGKYRRELYPKHVEHFAAGRDHKYRAFMAANRIGKGLQQHELVQTPRGSRPIGALAVGDDVIGSDGHSVKVLALFRRGYQDLYRVTLTDGSSVVTDSDHLWRVRTSTGKRPPKPWRLRSTREMFVSGRRYELPDRPVVAGVGDSQLPLDPYLLGCLLGDGGLTQRPTLTTVDSHIVSRCRKALRPLGCRLRQVRAKGRATSYSISAARRETNARGYPLPSPAAAALQDCGLLGLSSHGKFVPQPYQCASPDARLELLRGLMDTDGTADASGTRSFFSVSERLAGDVQRLAHSLGFNASLKQKRGRYRGRPHISWRVTIYCGGPSVFSLPRKAARERRRWRPQRALRIKAIEPVLAGQSICMRIGAVDGIFLTGQHIPTHNTYAGGYELSCHATGWYPEWWPGWTVDRPGKYLVAAKFTRTLKKVTQRVLFGGTYRDRKAKYRVKGDGMLPAANILHDTSIFMTAAPGTLSEIGVRWRDSTLEWSTLEFLSYEMGRGMFEGTEYDLAWLDEESPLDIYVETAKRLMTTSGRMVLTWTPLDGLTDLVLSFMPAELRPPEERLEDVDALVPGRMPGLQY